MRQLVSDRIALVLFGNGGHLGDFEAFVNSLANRDLSRTYEGKAIVKQSTLSREEVFQAILSQATGSIQELHVFSHSIGGGLYPGYEVGAQEQTRRAAQLSAYYQNRKISYEEVLRAEVGGILTDHLVSPPLSQQQSQLQARFAANASAKFWGCNSGVANWRYTDLVTVDASGRQVLSPDVNLQSVATAAFPNQLWREYYWRALNTKNVPKPSIAQALAKFLGIKVYGAHSGAHVEVSYHGQWVTSNLYRSQTGHWPGGAMPLRMQPDRGDYAEFRP